MTSLTTCMVFENNPFVISVDFKVKLQLWFGYKGYISLALLKGKHFSVTYHETRQTPLTTIWLIFMLFKLNIPSR